MAYDLQYISDYIDIRSLNALYNRYADLGDGKLYASLFTENAEFEIVGNRVYLGREEIACAAATQVTVHVTTEPELRIASDAAAWITGQTIPSIADIPLSFDFAIESFVTAWPGCQATPQGRTRAPA